MRRAPLPILLASLLLVSQAPLGAGRVPDFDGSAVSVLRLWLLRLGGDRAGPWPLSPPLLAPGPDVLALVERPLVRSRPPGKSRHPLPKPSERPKRNKPPFSIDLSFHLLRQMLEVSLAESKKKQAEKNRIILETVGK